MNKKKKDSVRSIWNIIMSTYFIFLKNMTGKCVYLFLLSSFPGSYHSD